MCGGSERSRGKKEREKQLRRGQMCGQPSHERDKGRMGTAVGSPTWDTRRPTEAVDVREISFGLKQSFSFLLSVYKGIIVPQNM